MLVLEQTPILVFFNILIIAFNYITLKQSLKYPYCISKAKYRLGITLCLLFCLFAFWGTDWFHYQDSFPYIKEGYRTHMEDTYVWIIQNICPNYITFRLIIWGFSLFLLIKTIKNLSVSKGLVLLFFSCIYIIWFSYARVSLAMALAFCGYSYIVRKNHTIKDVLLGFVLLFSSYFFHKSSIFAMGVIGMSLLLKKYPRYSIWILITSFPFIIVLAKIMATTFMITDVSGDGDMATYMEAGQQYMDQEGGSVGIGAMIQIILEKLPYYLIAFISFCLIRLKRIHIPVDIKAFMTLQIIIVVVSSVFAFNLGVNTSTLYTRFLRFAMIPSSIILAYLYQIGYRFKLVNLTMKIAVFGTLYALFYSLYNSAV